LQNLPQATYEQLLNGIFDDMIAICEEDCHSIINRFRESAIDGGLSDSDWGRLRLFLRWNTQQWYECDCRQDICETLISRYGIICGYYRDVSDVAERT